MKKLIYSFLVMILTAYAGILCAQEDEFIFTSLIVDKSAVPASQTKNSQPLEDPEEMTFGSLIKGGVPVANLAPAAGEAPKPETVVEPAKRLRDPFWPLGYIPKEWEAPKAPETVKESAPADWVAASQKIKVNFTKVVRGKSVAMVNGKLKTAGDQLEIVFDGYRFRWKLIGIRADGKLKLQKLISEKINP